MGSHRACQRGERELTMLVTLALMGACAAEPPPAPANHLVVRMQASGMVEERDIVFSYPIDATQRCMLPSRWRARDATGTERTQVGGYVVTIGPHFPPDTDRGMRDPFPGAWMFGPQRTFLLEILPEPDQEATEGPVRLSARFRIRASAGPGLFERLVEADDLPRAGFVRMDADMRGGRFMLRDLPRQLHHNRAPENEVITVSGSWRCPAPD